MSTLIIKNREFEGIEVVGYIQQHQQDVVVVTDVIRHFESGRLQDFFRALFYCEAEACSRFADISVSTTVEYVMKDLLFVLSEIENEYYEQREINKSVYNDDYDEEIEVWGFSRV